MFKKDIYKRMNTSIPEVYRILFLIHGSKFKPDPLAYLGKASEICKSHRVLFFCVCKHPFDCFFSFVIQLFHADRMPYILDLFHIIKPYMLGYGLFTFGIFCAFTFIWTIFADVSFAFVFSLSLTISCCIV